MNFGGGTPPPFYCGEKIMFESSNRITLLCKTDYARLTNSIAQLSDNQKRQSKGHPKLDTALVVDDHMLPDDMARIGSVVCLKDLGTGSIARFVLSENEAANVESDDKIRTLSVTSSLGIALLGARLGEHIKWTLPNGHTRYLRISELSSKVAVC
jgi:regulator of nucleoside diphosphate kinase